ncbi:hypothetical protein PAT3040_03608 [Paenibacillus agaridevorans]|uniref:Uncharacterized protein n=1 Tax=Paenibacillus agaridevorans TaxID=171404 RepID=A0A2R5ETI2_9BACL|nr:hypothetical protein [Paenibacillus agaridevorans]GBG08989.1 hypothetical protein PAT3040_03608 [Paenibacillus agaridevorans]
MEEKQICPWCQTEITWDEEIGPESHCPHCENELSGYRTMNIGIGDGGESDDLDEEDMDLPEWNDTDDDSEADWAAEQEGYIGATRSTLAAQGVIQEITEAQYEVPECPNCREYMLEAGTQVLGGEGFVPTAPEVIGEPILPSPFRIVWYVCPSCFATSSQLSASDREYMMGKLSERE